ncbi:hypothetical protein FJY70_05515, partial [candidate division WOR-3 bacterium]|nr:hypothetical protein [candidate division WOR-3 bacterium]
DLSRVSEQRVALAELVGLLRLIGDNTARELYVNLVADRFRVDRSTILGSINQTRPDVKKSGTARRLEEQLLGSAIQGRELAVVARDLGLGEVIQNEKLREVAELMAAHCDRTDFGPGLVLDLIADEQTRQLVSAWTFEEAPTPAEFEERLKRARADWLRRRLQEADARGDEAAVEDLQQERSRLLQQVARERSARHDRQHGTKATGPTPDQA